jgi:hypothetical protein
VEPVVHRRNTSTRGLSQPKPSNVLARRILGGGPNTQEEWDGDYSYQDRLKEVYQHLVRVKPTAGEPV